MTSFITTIALLGGSGRFVQSNVSVEPAYTVSEIEQAFYPFLKSLHLILPTSNRMSKLYAPHCFDGDDVVLTDAVHRVHFPNNIDIERCYFDEFGMPDEYKVHYATLMLPEDSFTDVTPYLNLLADVYSVSGVTFKIE